MATSSGACDEPVGILAEALSLDSNANVDRISGPLIGPVDRAFGVLSASTKALNALAERRCLEIA
jgi:hypothetical protein